MADRVRYSIFVLALFCALFATGMSASTADEENRVSQLSNALWLNDTDQAKAAIASGPIPDTDNEGICWLHAAILHGMPELLAPLVDAGVPIECTHLGQTPLQYAIDNGAYGGAEKLVILGADVNAGQLNRRGDAQSPPLDAAVFKYLILEQQQTFGEKASELKNLIAALIQNGADPNLVSGPSGITTLAIAAQQGATDIVRELLQAGADPNQLSGEEGKQATALEVAIFNGSSNIRTVELLLYAGADPTAGPHADKLLEEAEQNLPNAVQLLKQHGAK